MNSFLASIYLTAYSIENEGEAAKTRKRALRMALCVFGISWVILILLLFLSLLNAAEFDTAKLNDMGAFFGEYLSSNQQLIEFSILVGVAVIASFFALYMIVVHYKKGRVVPAKWDMMKDIKMQLIDPLNCDLDRNSDFNRNAKLHSMSDLIGPTGAIVFLIRRAG